MGLEDLTPPNRRHVCLSPRGLTALAQSVPRGSAIFFEFKHYKPKKKKISTRSRRDFLRVLGGFRPFL